MNHEYECDYGTSIVFLCTLCGGYMYVVISCSINTTQILPQTLTLPRLRMSLFYALGLCKLAVMNHRKHSHFLLSMRFAMSRMGLRFPRKLQTLHSIWHGGLRFPRKSQVGVCNLQGLQFPARQAWRKETTNQSSNQ